MLVPITAVLCISNTTMELPRIYTLREIEEAITNNNVIENL